MYAFRLWDMRPATGAMNGTTCNNPANFSTRLSVRVMPSITSSEPGVDVAPLTGGSLAGGTGTESRGRESISTATWVVEFIPPMASLVDEVDVHSGSGRGGSLADVGTVSVGVECVSTGVGGCEKFFFRPKTPLRPFRIPKRLGMVKRKSKEYCRGGRAESISTQAN